MSLCDFDSAGKCRRCGYQAKRAAAKRIRQCGVIEGGEPALVSKLSSYARELATWIAAGRPVRSDVEVESLLAICQPCDQFNGAACRKCGCKINRSRWAFANKLRMATTACPLHKWGGETVERPHGRRVGIVIPNLLAGGVERWAITLARHLPAHGVDIAGVAFTGGSGVLHEPTLAELAALCPVVGTIEHEAIHRVGRPSDAIYAVAQGSDVLLVWSATGETLAALRAVDVPTIGISHGCHDWWMAGAKDIIDRWVAVSQAAARPVPGEATILHNGIDLDRLTPTEDWSATREAAGIPRDAKVAVSVGRLSKEKRLHLAAAAIEHLPDDCWLWLVGDGGDRERIMAAAGRRAGRIVVSPARGDIGNVLVASDVALMLSAAEGYGLAPVEALAAGVPLVSTPVGVLPEIDRQCRFAAANYLPLHPTPQQVAQAIVGAADAPRERLEAVAGIVRREHSGEAMARRWVDFLASLRVRV